MSSVLGEFYKPFCEFNKQFVKFNKTFVEFFSLLCEFNHSFVKFYSLFVEFYKQMSNSPGCCAYSITHSSNSAVNMLNSICN